MTDDRRVSANDGAQITLHQIVQWAYRPDCRSRPAFTIAVSPHLLMASADHVAELDTRDAAGTIGAHRYER